MKITNALTAGFCTVLSLQVFAANSDWSGGSNNQYEETISVPAILNNSQLDGASKARQLANAAEKLMTPGDPTFANQVANLALSQDALNPKAMLIRALTAPEMELRGLLSRLEPLAQTNRKVWRDYVGAERSLQMSNSGQAASSFLFSDLHDLKSERDLQEVVARYTAKVNELRQTLAQLQNYGDIELNISRSVLRASVGEESRFCTWEQVAPMQFRSHGCSLNGGFSTRLSSADFEALEEIVSGVEVGLSAANAWSWQGAVAHSTQLGHRSVAEAMGVFLSNPDFGKIRKSSAFLILPDRATDLLAGIRYAMAYQKQLCPKGHETGSNRPGYLFKRGFCVHDSNEAERAMATAQLLIQGQSAMVYATVQGADVGAEVNVAKFINQPIPDLRSLSVQTDSYGNIISIGDGNFGGVFGYGQLNWVMNTIATSNATRAQQTWTPLAIPTPTPTPAPYPNSNQFPTRYSN